MIYLEAMFGKEFCSTINASKSNVVWLESPTIELRLLAETAMAEGMLYEW